jgi:hypothetical protein
MATLVSAANVCLDFTAASVASFKQYMHVIAAREETPNPVPQNLGRYSHTIYMNLHAYTLISLLGFSFLFP